MSAIDIAYENVKVPPLLYNTKLVTTTTGIPTIIESQLWVGQRGQSKHAWTIIHRRAMMS